MKISHLWERCILFLLSFFLSLLLLLVIFRAGNSLIGFLSELLVFCKKGEWAIPSKKRAIRSFAYFWWGTWAICSWSLIFGERPERITHGRSFLVSNLLLTSLIFGEQPERFAHIAQGKWAIVSESLTSLTKKEEMSDLLIFQ